MAQSEITSLRAVIRQIASSHRHGSVTRAADQVDQSFERLQMDPTFVTRSHGSTILRDNVRVVREEIERWPQTDLAELGDHLASIGAWAFTLAGDPTTPPPRRRPKAGTQTSF